MNGRSAGAIAALGFAGRLGDPEGLAGLLIEANDAVVGNAFGGRDGLKDCFFDVIRKVLSVHPGLKFGLRGEWLVLLLFDFLVIGKRDGEFAFFETPADVAGVELLLFPGEIFGDELFGELLEFFAAEGGG